MKRCGNSVRPPADGGILQQTDVSVRPADAAEKKNPTEIEASDWA